MASYPVTINVKKDGGAFGDGAPTVTFGTTAGSAVANGTSVGDGTYNIYANGIDTGADVTVSGAAASVDLNYYTVTFKNEGNTSTLDTQTVLSGQPAIYGGEPLTKTSTAQYSYTFSKWVTTAGGAYTTGTFTLNNTTREGYTFVGWTGSNCETAQTNVSISTGSTGNKTYTANWKADKPATAPAASIVTEKTDTRLTITTFAVRRRLNWNKRTADILASGRLTQFYTLRANSLKNEDAKPRV